MSQPRAGVACIFRRVQYSSMGKLGPVGYGWPRLSTKFVARAVVMYGVCQVARCCSFVHMPADRECSRQAPSHERMSLPSVEKPSLSGGAFLAWVDSESLQVVVAGRGVKLGKPSRIDSQSKGPCRTVLHAHVLSSDVVRLAVCSVQCVRACKYHAHEPMRRRCSTRGSQSVVRWQSETRIKVQPLCHNGNGNIES